MRTAGIICECNPFHEGHRYLIESAKRSGCDAVVCVMSGCFTERGEPAIADGFYRTGALLASGADVVVELPYPWSASSAEFFARAGVEILSRLGVNELWFGSECGDLAQLACMSEICDSAEFAARYAERIRESDGTAKAYFDVLSELMGAGCECAPNDILGISYLRAIRTTGSSMIPHTVRRVGSGYSDREVRGEFPSATALRALLYEGGMEAAAEHLLPVTAEWLVRAMDAGAAPARWQNAERLVLGSLRLLTRERIDAIAELSGGLGMRLRDAANRAESFEELLSLAATKKYPTARIQRGILYAMTELSVAQLRSSPAYVRLFGATRVGREVLGACKKSGGIPVVTRRADLPAADAEVKVQLALEERAWALYTLCLPRSAGADSLWRKTPILTDKND